MRCKLLQLNLLIALPNLLHAFMQKGNVADKG